MVKAKTIDRTVTPSRAAARLLQRVNSSNTASKYALAIVPAIVAISMLGFQPTYAVTLTDVITAPVSTVQNIVAPIATQTTPSSTTTNIPSTDTNQSASTTQPSSQQTTQQSDTTSQQTTPSSTAQPQSTTSAPIKEAGDQSVTDTSPISYVSRQISKGAAGSLYIFASALALFGLIVYLVTLRPKAGHMFKHLKATDR